jgi:hypothetical protein
LAGGRTKNPGSHEFYPVFSGQLGLNFEEFLKLNIYG